MTSNYEKYFGTPERAAISLGYTNDYCRSCQIAFHCSTYESFDNEGKLRGCKEYWQKWLESEVDHE